MQGTPENNIKLISLVIVLCLAGGLPDSPACAQEEARKTETSRLTSGGYFVAQTWSQEQNYRRPYLVSVPEDVHREKLPVLIFLHGNGGNAQGTMRGFMRHRGRIASRYVTVFRSVPKLMTMASLKPLSGQWPPTRMLIRAISPSWETQTVLRW